MTIEIKQMLIKSTVRQMSDDKKETVSDTCSDLEDIKEEILAECRQLIVELLRDERER